MCQEQSGTPSEEGFDPFFHGQPAKEFVIPAHAGIQARSVNPVFLDSGFYRNNGFLENLLSDWFHEQIDKLTTRVILLAD